MPETDRHTATFDLKPVRKRRIETHLDARPYGAAGVLKDPARRSYFRLSPLGATVWQKIDGRRSIGAIIGEVVSEVPEAESSLVWQLIAQLRRSGFLHFEGEAIEHEAPSRRIEVRWSQPLVCEVFITRCDGWFEWIYRYCGGRTCLRLLAAMALALGSLGLVVFLRAEAGKMAVPHVADMPVIILAGFCTTLLHESAHGTAVKYFGRTVGAVGAGWFWFGPAFFVDTSDMWLGTRLQRIAVSLAGPMVEFTLAGAAALAAETIAPGAAGALLVFSAVSYWRILFNLCPLLEYDGYFVLSDILKRPNLRRRACGWLRQVCRRDGGLPTIWTADDRVFLGYSLASLVYIIVLAIFTSTGIWVPLRAWTGRLLPETVSTAVTLVACLAFTSLVLYGILRDFFTLARRRA